MFKTIRFRPTRSDGPKIVTHHVVNTLTSSDDARYLVVLGNLAIVPCEAGFKIDVTTTTSARCSNTVGLNATYIWRRHSLHTSHVHRRTRAPEILGQMKGGGLKFVLERIRQNTAECVGALL